MNNAAATFLPLIAPPTESELRNFNQIARLEAKIKAGEKFLSGLTIGENKK